MRRIRQAEEQHIGIGNRAGAYADHIADHAAHARVRPAKRLNRRRAVMRLHLKGDVVLFIEGNNPGVIHKCRAHPRLVDLLGGRANICVEQAVYRVRAFRPGVINHRFERLMNAVFAPRLRQHFQFGIGRVALFLLEVIADGLHLAQVQRQPPLPADRQQRCIVSLAQRDHLNRVISRLIREERRADRLVNAVTLDDGISADLICQPDQLIGAQLARKQETLACRGAFHPLDAQQAGCPQQVLCGGVGHAGQQRHVNEIVGLGLSRVPIDVHAKGFSYRVCQQFPGDALHVLRREVAL